MLIKPTNENIDRYALAPVMRELIPVALAGSTMTYGEGREALERKVGFSSIFTTRMGFIVGSMMNRLLEVDENAPLLNVLMVSQQDGMPSDGAATYLAERCDMPLLARPGARRRHPDDWRRAFNDAAKVVYAYPASGWADLYAAAFGDSLPLREAVTEREASRRGAERDGLDYGRHGEQDNHRALRLWVQRNPQAIRPSFAGCRAETEVCLESADRVDAVFYGEHRIAVVEVKSRDSNDADLRRGVFQCIKYRAVQQAMDVRQGGEVEAVLVTERRLPGELRALARRHGVAHVLAPLDRR